MISARWQVLLKAVALALCLFVGLGGGIAAAAQTIDSPPGEFNLDDISSLADVLRIALATDKGIRLSALGQQEAYLNLKSVETALRPQFIAGGNVRRENVANNSLISGMSLMSDDDQLTSYSGTLTYAQQLGLNPDMQTMLDSSRVGQEISEVQTKQAVYEMISNVQQAYIAIVNALNGLELANLAVENAKLSLAAEEDKMTHGAATPLDVFKEENALREAEQQRDQARLGLRTALLGLLQIINLDKGYLDEGEIWIQELVAKQDDTPSPWPIDFEQVYALALENRPDVQMARKQQELAQVELDNFRRDNDWSAELSGRYAFDSQTAVQGSLNSDKALQATLSKSELRGLPDNVPDALNPNEDDTDRWQIGLSVSYQFGDGGRRQNDEQKLELAVERAELQYKSATDMVYLDVFNKVERLDQAWKEYELACEREKEAEATFAQMQEMYEMGMLTEKDLHDALLMVRQAENNVVAKGLAYQATQTELAVGFGADVDRLIDAVGAGKWAKLLIEEIEQ